MGTAKEEDTEGNITGVTFTKEIQKKEQKKKRSSVSFTT